MNEQNEYWQVVVSPATAEIGCLGLIYIKGEPLTVNQIVALISYPQSLIAGAILSLETQGLVELTMPPNGWYLSEAGQTLTNGAGLDRERLRQWMP